MWPIKKLGEIAEVIMGQSPPSSSYNERGEGLPFFQGKAEFGEIYPTPVKYCSSPSRIAEENDILISVRAPVGNINIAREKSCVGRGLGALRAKKNILNQMFLFYFMKKNENNWSRLSTGSTFSAIKGSSLKNFEIHLPPPTTQKQIVERLDKIAEAQKLNNDLIQKSDELFQSLLHQELNPTGKDWEMKKLGDCMIQFDRGISWSHKDEGGTVAVLRIPNIKEGEINIDDLKYIDIKNGNGKLEKDDIVMVASNSNPDLVGRSALVTEREAGIRFASFLVKLRFDDKKLSPQYAHLFLLTSLFKRELRRKIATTSGIYNLRKEHIEKVKILVPPLKIQKQIVAKLSAVQEYKTQLLAQKSKLKEFFDSVLSKSMSQVNNFQLWTKKKSGKLY